MKDWEIIADNLSKAGWSWGCVSAVDRQGRTIWIADAHRDDGKRFVVRADEKLTAFLELEAVTTQSIATTRAAGCGAGNFCKAKHKERRARKRSSRYQSHKGE
jgi:hypothetical protein